MSESCSTQGPACFYKHWEQKSLLLLGGCFWLSSAGLSYWFQPQQTLGTVAQLILGAWYLMGLKSCDNRDNRIHLSLKFFGLGWLLFSTQSLMTWLVHHVQPSGMQQIQILMLSGFSIWALLLQMRQRMSQLRKRKDS